MSTTMGLLESAAGHLSEPRMPKQLYIYDVHAFVVALCEATGSTRRDEFQRVFDVVQRFGFMKDEQ